MTQKLHFHAAVFSGYFDLINLSDIVIALMTWDGVTDSLPKIYWRRFRRAQTFLCYTLYETSRNTQTSFQKYKYKSRTLSDSKESLEFLLLSSRFWILFKRNSDASSISYWEALIKFNLSQDFWDDWRRCFGNEYIRISSFQTNWTNIKIIILIRNLKHHCRQCTRCSNFVSHVS